MMPSIIPKLYRSCAVICSVSAASASRLGSFQRMDAQPRGEITEYRAFSSMSTRSATASAGAALTRHDRDNRRFQLDKLIQTAGNGLALTAFLRANAAERAAGVNKVDDRAVEFLRLMCETQGLSIALRVRHAEVGVHILLNGAALAVADYRHRCAVEVANAAEDGMVVRKIAVAVQLGEVGEQFIDIIRDHRALGIVDDTHLRVC